ncbi:MAG: hypothetical protein QM831_09325 [Kofleriaceae bacterium]
MGGERADTGQCPAGETCSPKTPNGLAFVGASFSDTFEITGPSPTAIGGTQNIEIQLYNDGQDLDLPYTADDDGAAGVKVDHQAGPIVSIVGMNSRSNYLRIVDASNGELFDRKMLTGASVDTVKLVPTTTETVPANMELAFMTGNVELGVALSGAVQEDSGPQQERLVDESMQLQLAGATQKAWDALELPSAQAGTYSLSVTAGNRPAATLDVPVVDHLDLLVTDADNDTSIVHGQSALVCFDGITASRYVAGLTWHFLVDNTDTASSLGNCIMITPLAGQNSVTVVGSAAGMSATATLSVGNSARRGTARAAKKLAPTAGERAAM